MYVISQDQPVNLWDAVKKATDKIPLRTLSQVRIALSRASIKGSDVALARLMFKHGRLTDEARAYVTKYMNGEE